jgi:hypothetical protein
VCRGLSDQESTARPSAARADDCGRVRGVGRCESTGESGARASWAMDRCLEGGPTPSAPGPSGTTGRSLQPSSRT